MSDASGSARGALRLGARVLLTVLPLVAGVAHLVDTVEFRGQVPPWLPWRDAVIVVSGLVELLLGAALLAAPGPWRPRVGVVVAAFFVLVLPGNISQYLTGSDAFGLDTDTGRLVRLFFQPVLVAWALWCTGGWALLRSVARGRRATRP